MPPRAPSLCVSGRAPCIMISASRACMYRQCRGELQQSENDSQLPPPVLAHLVSTSTSAQPCGPRTPSQYLLGSHSRGNMRALPTGQRDSLSHARTRVCTHAARERGASPIPLQLQLAIVAFAPLMPLLCSVVTRACRWPAPAFLSPFRPLSFSPFISPSEETKWPSVRRSCNSSAVCALALLCPLAEGVEE